MMFLCEFYELSSANGENERDTRYTIPAFEQE